MGYDDWAVVRIQLGETQAGPCEWEMVRYPDGSWKPVGCETFDFGSFDDMLAAGAVVLAVLSSSLSSSTGCSGCGAAPAYCGYCGAGQ